MKIVIALGGNALGENHKSQKIATTIVSREIVKIVEMGHVVILTHGNGPQVGLINSAFNGEMPLDVCNSMSAGYIGYHLQNSLINEFIKKDIKKEVSTVITQVMVDEFDKAMSNPTKPIGIFYTEAEAEVLSRIYPMMEDAGRGYRRVVPSPKPLDIIEKESIKTLVSEGHMVIACGGGGIPVVRRNKELIGIEAVIDKDLASSLLADLLDADILLILTTVEKVYINYGTDNQIALNNLNLDELNIHLNNNEFKTGSMKPKIEAARDFVSKKKARTAIITCIESATSALSGLNGTQIAN